MTDAAATLTTADHIRKNWGWFLGLGIVFLVGGVFAIAMPFIAGLAVTVMFSIVLAWIGVMQLIQAFGTKSWGGFIWQLIIGLVLLAGGVVIWLNPIFGIAWLTILIAAVFIVKGVFQVILAFHVRPHGGWGWMLTAGILAIIVGLIIWLNWPISTAWAPGTLAGISLIFTGWSYIMISMVARRT